MGRNYRSIFFVLFSVILLFSVVPNPSLSAFEIDSEFLESSFATNISLTNFTLFEKFTESPLIYSTRNDTHIDFIFNQSSPSHPHWERYEYILPGNCSDFSISLNIQYNMSSVSEGMIVYFTAYGEVKDVIENGIQDAWAGSQGLYYVKAWPFGAYDLHLSPTNSAGLSGNVTFQISRTDNIAVGKILDKNASSILHSYQWTEGLEAKIQGITASFRTNFDATKMQATFSGLNANFTFETIDPTTPPTIPSVIFGLTSNTILIISSVVFCIVIMREKRRSKN